MENQEKKSIVEKYFKCYNEFDVDKMVSYLHEDVEFKNISQGQVTLALNGKKSFTNQARQAVSLFEKRELKIDEIEFDDNVADIKINFMGILAVDVPEGPSKGEKVELKGRTVLKFQDGKISSIEDIS
ncbi:MAG: nuclear transport factor 2 family protein [Methanobacteriaceae archaeon]|nr:nuclear transport factor 2 family protein [Methanobacteriaceae archaeon]MDP2835418.1 nuclear transport factor 2 family protein [Methanobacteriaceae archaeon]MDP3033607.1 nuclear transport factor 2 family protein [Methanobacteriaceae archaeon]MDP3486229.1 nuclear transport factor 2 family protein [Methanobacteriaceae archaeon]MDP3624140.1 nuclear transport factor 2 family protein [Methanobacteriaceae archaeon]